MSIEWNWSPPRKQGISRLALADAADFEPLNGFDIGGLGSKTIVREALRDAYAAGRWVFVSSLNGYTA